MHFIGVFNSRSCYSIFRQIQIRFSSNHVDVGINALFQQRNYLEALELYAKDSNFQNSVSRFTIPSLLKACASLSNFRYGETIHSTIIKLGLLFDPYIISSLVRMYVKCGSLGSAVKVFDEMLGCEIIAQDVAIWNSIIDGYSKNGLFNEGIACFRRKQQLNVRPDGYTLCILLGMCSIACNGSSSYGREIHGYVVRNMFDDDAFVTTALIDLYSKSNRIVNAWNVFNMLADNRTIAVWNSMINGFCETGLWRNALQLYSLAKSVGLELGSTTFSCALTACSQGNAVDFGRQLHCDVVKTCFESDPYVATSLLTFYSKCGFFEDAETVFRFASDRKVELWNSIISGYVTCGRANDALDMYAQMRHRHVEPDSFTVSNVLIACSLMGSHSLGKSIHAELLKRPIKEYPVPMQSALLTMYSKLGNTNYAHKVFSQISDKDVVAWGSIISASLENKKFEEALCLYKTMESNGVKPDAIVAASVIIACARLGDGKLGSCVHGLSVKDGFDSDGFVGTALIEFYSKVGQPEMAKTSFSSVLRKNTALWNALMSCYSQNGLPDAAISLLSRMQQDGLPPDTVSITTVLAAVSQMAALLKGKTVHGYHIKSRLPADIQVANALLDMYIKCGSFAYAERVFQSLARRDIVAWNSMIGGYGIHGECHKTIELYHEMTNSGTSPDEITFLALISSCNHGGLIKEGLQLFQSMRQHKIEPKMEHYINMVDLLGRSGRLYEAYKFIQDMAVAPGRGVWLSLLSACRVHQNIELGEMAAQNLIKMAPDRGSNYVLLMNLYVDVGMKDKAAEVRAVMRQKGVAKKPGCSWIEVKDKVEVFFSGESGSWRGLEIHGTLDCLRYEMRGPQGLRQNFIYFSLHNLSC